MRLKNTFFAAAATLGLIAAAPAWAQSSGPANASVPASAVIIDSELVLEVLAADSLNFGAVARPNGVVAGAQCRYDFIAGASVLDGQLNLAELRNGLPFDNAFPTPSGCEARDNTGAALAEFEVRCTPTTPVTFSAVWTSQGAQGIALSGNSQAVVIPIAPTGTSIAFTNMNPSVPTVFACPNISGVSQQGFRARIGGRLVLDTNAATGSVQVGTLTLNASY